MFHAHNIGKRRTVLVIAAAHCLIRSTAHRIPFLRGDLSQGPFDVAAAGQHGLFDLWLLVWAVTGFYCLWNLRTGHLLRPLSAMCGVTAVWGIACLFAGEGNLAVLYLILAGLVGALVTLTPVHPAATSAATIAEGGSK